MIQYDCIACASHVLQRSERQGKTGATGEQLKEGALINKSLSTLGLVIKALADQAKASSGKKSKGFVPYRDSTLTYLLQNNLGGNSKTLMMAAISPSEDNYDETLSTLRYADSAKKIVNHAVVNEDPNARMIRNLRDELERLRSAVGAGGASPSATGPAVDSEEYKKMQAELEHTEELMKSMSMSWEDKLKASEAVIAAHTKVLTDRAATLTGELHSLELKTTKPHLVSVQTGLDTAVDIYTLDQEITRIGTDETADPVQDICLAGEGVEEEQCMLELTVEMNAELGKLTESVIFHPIGEHCYVNEAMLEDEVKLHHGDVVQIGETHLMRFNHPLAVEEMRSAGKSTLSLIPARLVSSEAAKAESALRAEDARLRAENARMQAEQQKLLDDKAAAIAEQEQLAAEAKAIQQHLDVDEAELVSVKKIIEASAKENASLRAELAAANASRDAALADAANLREQLQSTQVQLKHAEQEAQAAKAAEEQERKQLEVELAHEHDLEDQVKQSHEDDTAKQAALDKQLREAEDRSRRADELASESLMKIAKAKIEKKKARDAAARAQALKRHAQSSPAGNHQYGDSAEEEEDDVENLPRGRRGGRA